MIKKLLFSVLLFFVFFANYGQSASSYCFSSQSGTYPTLSGTTDFPGFSGNSEDDAVSSAVTLPFTFGFGGADYTQVRVSSNGWLSFGSATVTRDQNYENNTDNAAISKPILMPLWDDLRNSNKPRYVVSGTAPNRIFKAEWSGQRWDYSSNNNVISFQIWLYETTNVIEYYYNRGANNLVNDSDGATIGVYDYNATYLTLDDSSGAPTAQASIFTTNIGARPANGQVYKFAPPTPSAQAGAAITFCQDNTNTQTLSVVAGQYALVNVIKGFNYTFSVPDSFSSNENLTLLDTSNKNFSPPVNAVGSGGTSITWTATYSGQVKVFLSTNCGSTGSSTMTLTQNSIGNTQDSQTSYSATAGTWRGHIYNWTGSTPPTNVFVNANYTGYYDTTSESFNQNYGGNATCFPVYSDGVERARIYTEQFAIRYKMRFTKPTNCYFVKVTGDDGVRFSTNGGTSFVFDRWVEQSPTNYDYILVSIANNADLIFDYYENNGQNNSNFEIRAFDPNANTITAPTTTALCSGADPALIEGSFRYNDSGTEIANPYINYQWQISDDNVTYTDITTNGTSRTYDPPVITNATSNNIVKYYRRIATVNTTNAPGVTCTFNTSNVVALTISPAKPATPGTISGLMQHCASVTGQVYSIVAVPNAMTYTWTVPTGWTITSGQGTTSITVTVGNSDQDGNVSVSATNGCGMSDNQSYLWVQINPAAPTVAPVVNAASNQQCNAITVNWSTVLNATGYYLDIATDNTFTNFVSGYNNYDINYSATSFYAGGLPSGTLYYRLRAYNSCGTTASSNTITFATTAPIGGTVAAAQTICSGTQPADLTLSGNTGIIIRWEKSNNAAFTSPTSINNTSATLTGATIGNLTSSTYFRAVVQIQSGEWCTSYSSSVLVEVSPSPIALLATNINCGGFTANWSVVANATHYLVSISEDSDFSTTLSAFTNVNAGNVTSFSVTGLTALKEYHFRIIAVTSCNSAPSNIISVIVQGGTVTRWNGSGWDNGIPNNSDVSIVFNGDYTTAGNLLGCSCQINSGTVTISESNILTLVGALKVAGGSLTFKDKSSLMQTTDVQNTGNIIYERETIINRFDYTYYSAPVSNQALVGVSPETLSDKFLSFDGANLKWVYENSASLMAKGKGYSIRGPQSYHNTTRAPFTAKFEGIPNNGPISGENVIATKSYIVGNPYPSAIKVSDFLAGNLFLEGTVRFWTHNTNITPSGSLYVYSSTDYAPCNATGCAKAQSEGVMPNGYIAAGQSVLVKVQAGVSPSQIAFNNGMRKSEDNSQFFKPSKAENNAKVWLNFSNKDGVFKQALVGYIDGATNSYEVMFDGTTSNANTNADFYSISDSKNLVIQGRSYPLDVTDIVALGYKSTIEGNFSIEIDHTDGDLDNQAVYLEDKLLNVVHDLKAKAYTFATAKGTFKERFILKYTNKTLGTADFEKTKNGVVVSVKEKTIKIESSLENIKNVLIYDVSGKLLYQKNKVDSALLSIEKLQSGNQVLLVKVVLDNDYMTTKKIVF